MDWLNADKEIRSQNGEKTVYHMRMEEGSTQVVEYNLFPGISLLFNEVHGNPVWDVVSQSTLLEMNHCLCGQYECEFEHGIRACVAEDDFAASPISQKKVRSQFTGGFYRGLSIMLEPSVAQSYLNRYLPGFKLHIEDLTQRLCPRACFVTHAQGALRTLFHQMYEKPVGDEATFYRIKVLELMSLLSELQTGCEQCTVYMRRERAELMSCIAEELSSDLQREITLEEIAQRYEICLSLLRREFVRMYGLPPSAYRKRCRMDAAARMLAQTNQRVIDVATLVGYENASKFSAAFYAEMGCSPVQYRKRHAILDSFAQ